MNDHELDLALGAIGVRRTRVIAPPALRERVSVVPTPTHQQPSWMPHIVTGRFPSMFGATKFVVAGVIVALFGGFLVTGILTPQASEESAPAAVADSPSPMTTQEMLSSFVTEEVEPGVHRVLNDGAGHDLVAEPPAGVTVAPDGSIWLLRASGERRRDVNALFELGEDGMHPFEADGPTSGDDVDLAVDAEGVVWVSIGPQENTLPWGGSLVEGTLASFDGTLWATPTWPDGSGAAAAIETTADGVIWVTGHLEGGAGTSVARIEDGLWSVSTVLDDVHTDGRNAYGQHAYFVAGPDGTAWLANGRASSEGDGVSEPAGLNFFDGQQWIVADLPVDLVSLPLDGLDLHIGPLALGPDGTLWAWGVDRSEESHSLARLDADGWTVFSEAGGVPLLVSVHQEARMAVDRGGRLWIAAGYDWLDPGSLSPSLGPSTDGPVGVLMFDGTTWNHGRPLRHHPRGRGGHRVGSPEREPRVAPRIRIPSMVTGSKWTGSVQSFSLDQR